jgi:solute carrier family 6 GABA transporter-like protein 1
MPGANFWAVFFFLTLMLLGISSTYPMLDVIVTGIMDKWGKRVARPVVATCVVLCAFLISLMYCTRFGYYLLDGVDRWINNLALVFVVWSELSLSTTIYRYRDVFGQVGLPAYACWNAGHFGGQLIGIVVGHTVSPAAGARAGFGVFIAGAAVAMALAKKRDADVPSFWGNHGLLKRFWFVAIYSVSP